MTEFICKPVTARTILTRLETVIFNPRPFVETPSYFGPDRRRNTLGAYIGPERRGQGGSKAEVIQQQALLDKAKTSV